jgi:hypothetical protein
MLYFGKYSNRRERVKGVFQFMERLMISFISNTGKVSGRMAVVYQYENAEKLTQTNRGDGHFNNSLRFGE